MASIRYSSSIVALLVAFLLFQILFCEAARILNESPSSQFVRTSNSQFQLNGSPYLFNGFNSYWMLSVASDPTQRFKVSNVFRDASSAGLTVCRTWAFNDGGYQALQTSPGVYDENVFQVYLHYVK